MQNKRIIALKGRGNSGKTTTINFLPNILIENGYEAVPNTRSTDDHGDFTEIFKREGIRIGVTSSGDTFDHVNQRLDFLVNANCNVCVCACRTRGGTHTAIDSFENYQTQYLQKSMLN